MPIEIIDTPVNVTKFLPKLGDVHTVIRYITRGNPTGAKHIKLPEVEAIKAAGKKLAIVHETYGDFAHTGHGGISGVDGKADGAYARVVMPRLGAPAGACVYFAVDVDGTAAQLKNNVLPYFKAIREAFADGEYRVGIYGPGQFCQAVKDAGYADLFWLANARGWKGYVQFKGAADLVQQVPTHIAGGLDVDPNVAYTADWGQFVPFADDNSLTSVTADGNAESAPRRLAQGDDVAEAHESIAASFGESGGFSMIKSAFQSKIAWLAGTLGGGSAASTVANDPDTMNILERLVMKPSFWFAVVALGIAGCIVYYRWRDHGKGSV